MAKVTDIIAYYVNLLIIQYNSKPKARATIDLFVSEWLASGIFLDIENAYNLDTAVGKQLDVLGKYEGVDRFYRELDFEDYFGFTDYTEVDPDSEPKFGFCTYATYDDPQHNGTLTYDNIISRNNRLFDEAFRTIIKLRIIQNNSDHSHKSIDDSVWRAFGSTVRPESAGNMQMVYFVNVAFTALLKAVLIKKILPRPMGVGLEIVGDVRGLMFGFTDYDGESSAWEYGFSDYSDYGSLPGQMLTYNQITQG
jgi:hypothetical protein